MKRCSLLLIPALLGVVLEAQTPIRFAEELYPELDTLIRHAGAHSTELAVSGLRIEEREGDLDVVRAQQRPQVNLNAQVTGSYETRNDINDEFRGNLNANLAVRQPVYQWGNLDRRETIAERRVAYEELNYEESGARRIMELRAAYLNWLLNRERREILEQSISLSESFVSARRKLLEVGQSSEQDVLEMEARLLENRESLAWVERSLMDLESQISRLAGSGFRMESLEGGSLSLIEPISAESLEALKRSVRSHGTFFAPEEDRWTLLETIEDEQLDILDRQNYPMVDLVAGIFSDQLDAVNASDTVVRIRYYAGVSVNWRIFDSWMTDGQKRSTLARKRAYALLREEAKTNRGRELEKRVSQIEFAVRQLEARGKREDVISRRVELLREQAQRNLITGAELIEGEIDYLEVRQRVLESRVNYLMNLMELGVLLDQDPASVHYSPRS